VDPVELCSSNSTIPAHMRCIQYPAISLPLTHILQTDKNLTKHTHSLSYFHLFLFIPCFTNFQKLYKAHSSHFPIIFIHFVSFYSHDFNLFTSPF